MWENYDRDHENKRSRTLFEQYLTEAPEDGDAPPDMTGAPDMPDEATPTNDDPPDMTDTTDEDDTPPPDMGGDDDTSMDDFGTTDDDTTGNDDEGQDKNQKLGLDDKVSAIMNANLYQRFMTMLTKISAQISSMKTNLDILHAVSPDVTEIIESLERLDDNIRAYIRHSFMSENYSKNLLFFNKCLNLMKLLNDSFDRVIRKGIKDAK